MKTKNSLMIAVILLSVLASNAFALIRSPYPRRPSAPNNIVVIADDRRDGIRSTLRASK